MKIISWNCNMAFRKKWHLMLDLKPDLLIIQECEHESKYKQKELIPNYNEFLWIGDNLNKGVGIISFNDYHIKIMSNYSNEYRYIIPIEVTGENTFNLYAIWAMAHKKKANSYVGQIWNAIGFYSSDLNKPSVLIGDFNSHVRWDSERKIGNHSQTVQKLKSHNILSVYHEINHVKHGDEFDPTLYLLKNQDKPYHMDYCFATQQMIGNQTRIKIGKFDDWIKVSDHMPIVIDHLGI